jgi:hypothetical protein
MLWDAPYIPQRTLSKAAVRSKLGEVLDIRTVSGRRAASYVSKYLAKDGMNHPAFRRARRFAIHAAEAEREPSDWRFTRHCPAVVAWFAMGVKIDWNSDGWCSLNKGAG